MKAVTWEGVDKIGVREVPDPRIQNSGDVILKVTRTAVCGSDLHLLGGYVPAMEKGDVLGHEILGEVVEVGEIPEPAAEGSAEPTLLNAPLPAATAHAKEGGRL